MELSDLLKQVKPYVLSWIAGRMQESGAKAVVPIVFVDPAAPEIGEMWVLKTASFTGSGTPIGLLIALTGGTLTGWTRQLSVKDAEGIFRVTLS